ncbi:MAG TPA: phosphopantetheine-binding protein [Rhodocyclaceae bacterium]|nr:phosphopantetheine-binding protein [Rhodocyclaceae bacterium]
MSDTLSIVRDFLKERLDVEPARVTPESTLQELGIDSLMLLELMFEFEEKLNVTLSEDLAAPTTVGELLTVVEGMNKPAA